MAVKASRDGVWHKSVIVLRGAVLLPYLVPPGPCGTFLFAQASPLPRRGKRRAS